MTLTSRFLCLWLVPIGLLSSCNKNEDEPDTESSVSTVVIEEDMDRVHPPVLEFMPMLKETSLLTGVPWVASFISSPQEKTLVEAIRGQITAGRDLQVVELTNELDVRQAVSPEGLLVLVDAYQRVRGRYDSKSPRAINALMTDLSALEAEVLNVPPDVRDPEWMKERAKAQLATADSIQAFHDFSFSDRREASGIRFMHKIVDESGKRFKGVHYDHGSGVAVADIDGDEQLDIYFVNQVGGNELWRNVGDGKFENITERAGVFVSDRVGVSASFADIDNDGDPDLYVTALRKGNVLFENLGDGRFRNITAGSGLGYKGHSSGAVFFDYDRDGFLDVFLANVGQYTKSETTKVTMESIRGEAETGETYHVGFADAFGGHLKPEREEMSRLYRNLGGKKFEDVSVALGLEDNGWTGDAAPVDIDSDGWTDLYLPSMQGDDEVYLNKGGKKFERAGRELFPKTPWGSMGIKAFDFENDGDLDLYITDMHSDMSEHIGPEREKEKADMKWTSSFLKTDGTSVYGNAFFRNDGAGSFEEVSDSLGAENYWPWGLSADDLNADGFDDAFVTSSMNFPLRYGVNSLLINDGGERFRDAEFILGVEPRVGGLAVPWFELDLIGADKGAPVIEAMGLDEVALGKLPERVVVWGAMGSRSSVIFDLDDDGDLDIVTNEMNHHPMVLVSDLSEKKPDFSYLKVKLVGTKSNRSALGAVVRVVAGDMKLMKVKDGQTGYLSHSDFPLYFGLGSAKQIDRLEVTWPSGTVQVVDGPSAANQLLTVTEPE